MTNLSSLLSPESPASPTPNWRRNSMTSDSDPLDMSGKQSRANQDKKLALNATATYHRPRSFNT